VNTDLLDLTGYFGWQFKATRFFNFYVFLKNLTKARFAEEVPNYTVECDRSMASMYDQGSILIQSWKLITHKLDLYQTICMLQDL
jgi:hypothetical protein